MVFLDTKNKVWKIRELTIPVIENIPMKELRWFKSKMTELAQREKELKEKQEVIGVDEEIKAEDEWYDKVCQLGLGKSMDDIVDTGISQPEFRELMAEVYTFLAQFGSVEVAIASGYYDPKIVGKEKEPSKNTQNS